MGTANNLNFKAMANGKIGRSVVNTVKTRIPEVSKGALKRIDPTATLRLLVESYRECVKTRQEEKTKRRQIELNEKVTIDEIRVKRELLMAYLEQSFDERRQNFERLFANLDRALEINNMELMAHTLNAITELGKSSPFRDLASVADLRRALEDPNKKFEF
jgi:hypothetical protein